MRPRVVDALQMANGNWLVEDGNDRRVYLPDEFERLFEVTPPAPCSRCSCTPYQLVTNDGLGPPKIEIKCGCP